MKKNPLLGALPIIAKALGRKLGVEVVIGARRQAGTDGTTIHLPPLPPESAPLAVLANGFIDHEAAHVRYTDFAVRKPAGLAGLLANLLEDIRVEQALGAAYPGSRANLAALVATLDAQEPLVPPAAAPVITQVLAALQVLLRARLLGQTALAAGAAAMEARLDALLPAGTVVKLLALAFEVRHTASTAEVIALARRIVAMLRDEARPPPSTDPSDTGQPGSAGDPSGTGQPSPAGDSIGGSPSSTGDPSGTGQPGSAGDPSGGPPSSAGDSSGGSPSSADAGGGGAGLQGARQAALAALLEAEAVKQAADIDVGARAGAALTARAAGDPAAQAVLAEDDDPPPNADPAAAVGRARAATALLRRRLGVLMQAHRDDDTGPARRGRRLDLTRLYRPSAGQPVRFVRRAERNAPQTAVGLLLDRSGSMNSVIDLAGQAVLAVALALETIPGVACWAAAFPGAGDDRVVPLLDFAERAGRVAGRFRLNARGGTPLGSALWRAGYALSQRPEPRRLLIVATDGEPGDPGPAEQALTRCRAGGIEVVGLGIGLTRARVQAVFGARDAAAIAAIAELAPALFALLERRLMRA